MSNISCRTCVVKKDFTWGFHWEVEFDCCRRYNEICKGYSIQGTKFIYLKNLIWFICMIRFPVLCLYLHQNHLKLQLYIICLNLSLWNHMNYLLQF